MATGTAFVKSLGGPDGGGDDEADLRKRIAGAVDEAMAEHVKAVAAKERYESRLVRLETAANAARVSESITEARVIGVWFRLNDDSIVSFENVTDQKLRTILALGLAQFATDILKEKL